MAIRPLWPQSCLLNLSWVETFTICQLPQQSSPGMTSRSVRYHKAPVLQTHAARHNPYQCHTEWRDAWLLWSTRPNYPTISVWPLSLHVKHLHFVFHIVWRTPQLHAAVDKVVIWLRDAMMKAFKNDSQEVVITLTSTLYVQLCSTAAKTSASHWRC